LIWAQVNEGNNVPHYVFAARDGFELLVFLAANSPLCHSAFGHGIIHDSAFAIPHSAFERAMSDAGDIELLAQRPPL